MIDIKTYTYKHIFVAEIQGVLDSQCAEDFRIWFEEKIKKGYAYIALDLLDMEFISSMGIGALVDVARLVKNVEGRLVLFNLNYEVKNIISFLKLDEAFIISENAEEAIQELENVHTSAKSKKYIKKLIESEEAEKAKEETEEQVPKILNCPYCSQPMKIKKTGKYLCPHCKKALEYS